MIARKNVCVIGAGVSGLAAAKAFKARGHDVTIIERSADLGGVWEPARSYPDVQTQSPKELYRYTDKAMPDAYPEWPKGPQVYAYLADYARSHDLTRLTRLNTTVRSMQRRADGKPGWTLDLETGDGARREDFDFVAVCTGQFNEPQTLSLPGEDQFKAAGGAIMHSSKYNDATLAKGRNIVVLGGSKSATDIAVNAVRSGARSVTIVFREPVWRIPYFIGGLINFKRILYIRAQEQMFASWGIGPLSRLAHMLAKPFVWANWRGLESLLKAQLKLGKCNMVPKERIEDGVNCSVPIATPDFYPMVADGRIKAVLGTFDHYEPNTIVASGGERIAADVAILAIGYKLGVPFLSDTDRAKLVDPDGQYRLYRLIANPDLPDMGFVGFNSSFCTVLCADMAAHWLVRYADRQLARQPSDREMRDNIEMMLRFKRVERPAAGVYGGLCVAPYHFKHFDELLADIGATRRKRSALAEMFTPPDADAYGDFLASAPVYQAG
ncbi:MULTISPECIES: flavin-containing monooxygenase [Bradyrhizobium]|jgi:cation diffusion facilitator CzcD-associated flavoprotein CzcO|uniref:Trimethylamine monooxygenase n=4 Tax=Bradyrhizobium TaxID=374 RepID=A0ABS5GF46_9BRAD|nr:MULTISPECIES: NAD(P)/FAD-dependent oxidoreductase [Bradyrhizobium]MBR1139952.1 NAD(P)/FAD-dependent oxidoreductase [Bradyrhizobium denitrificans]MDU1495913.1 NAD(P)/FAD-dependent oxidoreductase [Bradyrhizobium sp.]MDU1546064.1 NAD(P)/FAD-dependent oxidoreductase [Bradyrhizobium sp.]MDU1690136.1 NAD(P)/FAD-dependent oxidoreductase [Bradyrhizobium sp.]MDU1803359.1 NAD(P)/FAD-dependent oxidoreductase [Bradyrhizobium sp.]